MRSSGVLPERLTRFFPRAVAATCSWLVVLVSHPVFASTVVPLDAQGLVEHSTVIGLAQVLRTQPVRVPGSGWVTQVELEFYDGLKGVKPGENLLIQTPGAKLSNGMEFRVAGAPRFSPGQLLFGCFHEHGGVLKPTAMSLGVLRVVNDEAGVLRVLQQTDGLSYAKTTSRSEPLQVRNRTLNDVTREFRQIIAEHNASPAKAPVVSDRKANQ